MLSINNRVTFLLNFVLQVDAANAAVANARVNLARRQHRKEQLRRMDDTNDDEAPVQAIVAANDFGLRQLDIAQHVGPPMANHVEPSIADHVDSPVAQQEAEPTVAEEDVPNEEPAAESVSLIDDHEDEDVEQTENSVYSVDRSTNCLDSSDSESASSCYGSAHNTREASIAISDSDFDSHMTDDESNNQNKHVGLRVSECSSMQKATVLIHRA